MPPITRRTVRSGVVGAVVGSGIGFIPLVLLVAPLIGGGVAGYLQGGDYEEGVKVGLLSGVISSIPFLLFFSLVASFLFAGSLFAGGFGAAGGILFFILIGLVFSLVWTVGLGGLGGYLGVYIAKETEFSM